MQHMPSGVMHRLSLQDPPCERPVLERSKSNDGSVVPSACSSTRDGHGAARRPSSSSDGWGVCSSTSPRPASVRPISEMILDSATNANALSCQQSSPRT